MGDAVEKLIHTSSNVVGDVKIFKRAFAVEYNCGRPRWICWVVRQQGCADVLENVVSDGDVLAVGPDLTGEDETVGTPREGKLGDRQLGQVALEVDAGSGSVVEATSVLKEGSWGGGITVGRKEEGVSSVEVENQGVVEVGGVAAEKECAEVAAGLQLGGGAKGAEGGSRSETGVGVAASWGNVQSGGFGRCCCRESEEGEEGEHTLDLHHVFCDDPDQ